jgi:hypothetical protein
MAMGIAWLRVGAGGEEAVTLSLEVGAAAESGSVVVVVKAMLAAVDYE